MILRVAMPDAGTDDVAALVATARLRGANAREADAAFRALYERFAGEVLAFLERLLGERALAEDALQETFFRAHRGLDRYEPTAPFRAWLYQIARHVAVDAERTRRKHERLDAVEVVAAEKRAEEQSNPVVSELERDEDRAAARAALDSLPEDARALLLQRHGLGLTLDELAVAWQCTEKTVRNRLKAAASLLARALRRDGREKA